MNTFYRNFFLATIGSLVLFACGNDDKLTSLSDEEAAEQVSAVLTSDINGLSAAVDALALAAGSSSGRGRVTCNATADTTLVLGFQGLAVSFDYSASISYGLQCDGLLPTALVAEFETNANYDGPRVATTGASAGSVTVTGLLATAYIVNGAFSRVGSISQKNGAEKTFTSEANVTITDMKIDKELRAISEGTIDFSFEGVSSSAANYAFNASATISEEGTATVTINSNAQYSINLATGELTPLQ